MRMLRKAVLTAVVMLLVAAGVYAESYAGFEVKEGLGGTKVIVLRLSEDYLDPTAGKYEVEFPVEYYKDLEKQLISLDVYMKMNDDELRLVEKTKLDELAKHLSGVLYDDEEYIGDYYTEYYEWCINISYDDNIRLGKFQKDLITSLKNIYTFLDYIRMGYDSKNLSSQINDKGKKSFLLVLEAFPAIEFKNLGLKL